MERSSVRYEVLENEEVAAEPVAMAMLVPPAPPPYSSNAAATVENSPSDLQPAKLPNYVEATTLPTYEEAERSKLEQAVRQSLEGDLTENNSSLECGSEGAEMSEATLGTDSTFICTFLVSFLLNWIGFLISVCISSSVAGQCGAMSGLGVSVIKWVLIIKQGHWVSPHLNGDSWLWWLLFFCGFLLFVRGIVQYMRVKYEWFQNNGRVRSHRIF